MKNLVLFAFNLNNKILFIKRYGISCELKICKKNYFLKALYHSEFVEIFYLNTFYFYFNQNHLD